MLRELELLTMNGYTVSVSAEGIEDGDHLFSVIVSSTDKLLIAQDTILSEAFVQAYQRTPERGGVE